jgi:hypothetical protein
VHLLLLLIQCFCLLCTHLLLQLPLLLLLKGLLGHLLAQVLVLQCLLVEDAARG